jgi:hypothetical protein
MSTSLMGCSACRLAVAIADGGGAERAQRKVVRRAVLTEIVKPLAY